MEENVPRGAVEVTLADIVRQAEREARRELLARILAMPVGSSPDAALEVVQVFRTYLVAVAADGGSGDLDARVAAKVGAALAHAMIALRDSIAARDEAAALGWR